MSAISTTPPQPVSLMKPKEIWNTMPGWGIVANLTPNELIVARRIQSIRKYLIIGLVVLVLVLGGLYGWAWTKSRAATSDLVAEQDRTTSLTAQQNKYGTVTTIQRTISSMATQIASLMTSDVDYSTISAEVRAALPAQASLKNVTITISKAGVSASSGGNSSSSSTTTTNSSSGGAGAAVTGISGGTGTNDAGKNVSGLPVIGTVALEGSVTNMTQVAEYVTALRRVTGFTDVIPTSNTVSGDTNTFSIALALTDQVLSHHFDVSTQDGSK